MNTHDQQSHIIVEVRGIVALVDDHLGHVQDGVARGHGTVQTAADHPEVVGRAFPIAAIHQTVSGRQDGSVVDQTSAAYVATAKRFQVIGFHPDRDLRSDNETIIRKNFLKHKIRSGCRLTMSKVNSSKLRCMVTDKDRNMYGVHQF